jgi:hypothetical protein
LESGAENIILEPEPVSSENAEENWIA